MKALRYFFCIVLPPLAVLADRTNRAVFFLQSLLTLLGWIPGIIHAGLVVNDFHEDKRAARYAVAR